MKKFSNITNYEVPKDPTPAKVDEAVARRTELKHRVIRMMDEMLRIRSHGSVRPEMMMPTSIEGKEMFAEALVDMIGEDDRKDAIKALESLKQTNRDWASIDEKIAEMSTQRDAVMERKFAGLADRWGQDLSLLSEIAETHAKTMDPVSLTEGIHCLSSMVDSEDYRSLRESLEAIRSAYLQTAR